MTAYYNENDKDAAAWLRELIKQGHAAPGEVDERSIIDVRPADLAGFRQCHFFAGIGGWSLALRTAGWSDEREVWTGSCPCQPFSSAGKQKGFADDRHLWPIWRELIRERRPAILFGEQVASATAWLGLVRSDLESMGYAVGAMPIQAASAGADHLRDRYWLVGHDQSERRRERRTEHEVRSWWPAVAGDGGIILADDAGSQGRRVLRERADQRPLGSDGVADAAGERRNGREDSAGTPRGNVAQGDREHDWVTGADGKARRVKPGVRLLVNGFPSRVGLLRGFGNAIDHRPAAAFIEAACEAIVEQ